MADNSGYQSPKRSQVIANKSWWCVITLRIMLICMSEYPCVIDMSEGQYIGLADIMLHIGCLFPICQKKLNKEKNNDI